jgi:hypothetical protein
MVKAVAFTFAAVCVVLAPAVSGGATQSAFRCPFDQLAFQRFEPSPPQQAQAVGFAVYNMGPPCSLALPVSLTLAHADGRPLRVTGGTSRLTLTAPRLRKGAHARAVWTYTNYCGADSKRGGPKVMEQVRVGRIELRGYGGGAPCYTPDLPVNLRLFAACPSANGPAVSRLNPGERKFALHFFCRR